MHISYRLDQSVEQYSKSIGKEIAFENFEEHGSTDELENLQAMPNFQV